MADDVVAEMVGRLGFEVDDAGLKRFEQGLEGAKQESDSLGVSGVALGEVIGNLTTKAFELGVALVSSAAAGARDLVVEFGKSTKELDAWSKKIGVAPDQLQRLEFATKSLGGEAEDVREGLQTWTENLGELTRLGSGPAADALGTLGLRIEDIKDLSPEESLKVFADALNDLPSEAEKVSVAMEVLGGEGSKLAPLLRKGGDGIQDLMDQADELGLVLDESAIAKGLATQKAFEGIENTTQALKNQIAVGLAPVVTDVAERFGEWYRANEEVIAQKLPEVIDAIVEGFGELVHWGGELASGLDNLNGLMMRLGADGEDSVGALGDSLGTMVEMSKAGIETFVEWTDEVAEMADLVWDVGEAIKDGLVSAYEDYLEPVVDTVTAAFSEQESTLGRVVDFVEDLIDRVIYLKDEVVGLVDQVGLGRAFSTEDRQTLEEARAIARAPATAARQAAAEERAYQERVSKHAAELISDAEAAEASKARRKRGEAFRRKSLAAAKGGGGGGGVDTRDAERLLGEDIRALAQASGASETARSAALEKAAEELSGGASTDVARRAAAGVLTSKTGVDLSSQGGAEAALFGQLTQIGGAEAARSATDGAKFVTIDQSVNVQVGGIRLEIPESYAQALGSAEIAGGVAAELQRALQDQVFGPIVDAQAARSAQP